MCLVAAVLLFMGKTQTQRPQHIDVNGMLAWFSILSAVVFFISDLIFRRFILSIKKLWVVEGVLVTFIIVLVLILTTSLQ